MVFLSAWETLRGMITDLPRLILNLAKFLNLFISLSKFGSATQRLLIKKSSSTNMARFMFGRAHFQPCNILFILTLCKKSSIAKLKSRGRQRETLPSPVGNFKRGRKHLVDFHLSHRVVIKSLSPCPHPVLQPEPL